MLALTPVRKVGRSDILPPKWWVWHSNIHKQYHDLNRKYASDTNDSVMVVFVDAVRISKACIAYQTFLNNFILSPAKLMCPLQFTMSNVILRSFVISAKQHKITETWFCFETSQILFTVINRNGCFVIMKPVFRTILHHLTHNSKLFLYMYCYVHRNTTVIDRI